MSMIENKVEQFERSLFFKTRYLPSEKDNQMQ